MSPRTLKISCAISILLNVFLLAALIGGAAWVQRRGPQGTGTIRLAGAELPPDQRRAFRLALRDARLEMGATIAAGRQARESAAAALRAATLDQTALAAALARVRATDFAIREHIEARAAAVAATLPPEQRALLAKGMVQKTARR